MWWIVVVQAWTGSAESRHQVVPDATINWEIRLWNFRFFLYSNCYFCEPLMPMIDTAALWQFVLSLLASIQTILVHLHKTCREHHLVPLQETRQKPWNFYQTLGKFIGSVLSCYHTISITVPKSVIIQLTAPTKALHCDVP